MGSITFDTTNRIITVTGYKDETNKVPWSLEDIYSAASSGGYTDLFNKISDNPKIYYMKAQLLLDAGFLSDNNFILIRDATYLAGTGRYDSGVKIINGSWLTFGVDNTTDIYHGGTAGWVYIHIQNTSWDESRSAPFLEIDGTSGLEHYNGKMYAYPEDVSNNSSVYVCWSSSPATIRVRNVSVYQAKNLKGAFKGFLDKVTFYNIESFIENPNVSFDIFDISVNYPSYYITFSGSYSGTVRGYKGRGRRNTAFYLWSFSGSVDVIDPDFDYYDRGWYGDASSNTGTIRVWFTLSGIVKDLNGNPIQNAEIKITDSQGNVYTTTTDSNGNFSIQVKAMEVKGNASTGVNADTFTDYNPFKIEITKYGYIKHELTKQIYQPIYIDAALLDFETYNNALLKRIKNMMLTLNEL